MNIYTTVIAAMFGLLMMAMPAVASAEVLVRPVRPLVVRQVVAPAPFTTVEYFRPWACANAHYRRHHWWRCH